MYYGEDGNKFNYCQTMCKSVGSNNCPQCVCVCSVRQVQLIGSCGISQFTHALYSSITFILHSNYIVNCVGELQTPDNLGNILA